MNDEEHPANVLIGKKTGKRIPVGIPVTLQVKNPDGSVSQAFTFVRTP